MKFTTALLFAEAVMAARLTQHRRENHKARALSRKSQPKIASQGTANVTEVEYSENWAGAVIVSSDITSVTAVITVPGVTSTGSSGEQCASAWVGIDGDTCETAILQTGIDFCIENGEASYDAWYEWYPGASFPPFFSSFISSTASPNHKWVET